MLIMSTNPLLENLDRTVFTFNMHNMAEICFKQVFKKKTLKAGHDEMTAEQREQVDLCVAKYMQSMKVVMAATREELLAA